MLPLTSLTKLTVFVVHASLLLAVSGRSHVRKMIIIDPNHDDIKGISERCLECICQVQSHCNKDFGCVTKKDVKACGPFKIKKIYWEDCKSKLHGADKYKSYEECTRNYECSKNCVKAYMKHYGEKHTCSPDCRGYAMMHYGGPFGCKKHSAKKYWYKIERAGCTKHC